MKKRTISKAFALFLVLALLIPCVPVVASAETINYAATRTADSAWYTNDSDSNATAEDTDDNTFYIGTPEELAYFMELSNQATPVTFAGKTIKLTKNIYWNYGLASSSGFAATDTTISQQGYNVYAWTPLYCSATQANRFQGTFDGCGHFISGLYITGTSNLGFFGKINAATIKNLQIQNSYVVAGAGGKDVGMIVGNFVYACNIENIIVKNCHLNTSSGSTTSNLGGICGTSLQNWASVTLTLTNCVVDAASTITGNNAVGGILGASRYKNVITMTDCINYATVTGNTEVAGLVGRLGGKGSFTRCTSFGTVKATNTSSAWFAAASLVAMRVMDDTAAVADGYSVEAGCMLVKFTDCFVVSNENSSNDLPVWINTNSAPHYQVVFYYSDVLKTNPAAGEEPLQAVANRQYWKNGGATMNNNGTNDTSDDTAYTMEEIAGNYNYTLRTAYPKYKLSAAEATTQVVKIQGVQTKTSDTAGKFDARFVGSVTFGTEVDQAAVKQVGYEISLLNAFALNTTGHLQTKVCENAYTSILANFGEQEISAQEKYSANYLATLVVTGIPATGTQSVLLRPFYKTADGTVYGGYVVVTFVNGKVAGSSSVATIQASAIALACSFNTSSYNIADLFPDATNLSVKKDGQTLNSTTVSLAVGNNAFTVEYIQDGAPMTGTVRIARREGHRVVFNSNGGSYIETKYVANGAEIAYDASVTPTRDRYTFAGWYNDAGEKVTLGSTPITADTVFTARWTAPTQYAAPNTTPLTYSSSSAALNVVWKDYDDAFGKRPAEVLCTLKNTSTNATYTVKVTKTSASFVGSAPSGAQIKQGAGNWTVKITGLTATYSFLQNDLGTSNYTTLQSGTAVVNTLKDYSPMHDDTAALMTENGRFYDYAGNVVVLKGVVTVNVGMRNFLNNTSVASLKRLQEEGVNTVRITMQLNADDTDAGYLTQQASTAKQTDARRAELMADLKTAIDTASSLGMYCIVDWGVLMLTKMSAADAQTYFGGIQADTNTFFSSLATAYKNNPYVIFEICNEPNVVHGAWATSVKPFEESVIRAIRQTGSKAVIIAAPNALARYLSDYTSSATDAVAGDDPIDKPFATELSYNLAYTFHCYAYTLSYNLHPENNQQYNYGWRLSEAIQAGLTVVATEFSPATAKITAQSTGGTEADMTEANKYLNTMLENDVSYMLFRYISDFATNKTSSQHMFEVGQNASLENGTWTYAMLTDCGKWFYDNTLNSTGFIKAANYTYQKPAYVS